jgi:hypothetical protein
LFAVGDIAHVPAGMDRHDFGETQPDFATQRWNSTTRQLEPRPAPVLFDRADELRARLRAAFEANADFMSVYNSLTNARKTTLRNAIDTVLTAELRTILGARRWRPEGESNEDF